MNKKMVWGSRVGGILVIYTLVPGTKIKKPLVTRDLQAFNGQSLLYSQATKCIQLFSSSMQCIGICNISKFSKIDKKDQILPHGLGSEFNIRTL